MADRATTFHLPPASPHRAALMAEAHAGAKPARASAPNRPLAMAVLPGSLESPTSRLDPADARAREEIAHQRAAGPGLLAVPSRRDEARGRLLAWTAKRSEAEMAGVDLRRATFVNKLVALGASVLTLAASAALTVCTGGAATPFLIVAAVRAAVLVGDCICAVEDYRRALDIPAKPPLPMGASALGNLLYGACTGLAGMDQSRARQVARYGSGVLLVGMAASGLATGLPDLGMGFVEATMRYVAGVGSMLAAGSQAHAQDAYDEVARQRDGAAAELLKAMLERTVPLDNAGLLAEAPGVGVDAREAQRRYETLRADFAAWCDQARAALALQQASAQTRADFERIVTLAREAARDGAVPEVGMLGADRASVVMRVVNDVVGMHALASLGFTALAHAGAWAAA